MLCLSPRDGRGLGFDSGSWASAILGIENEKFRLLKMKIGLLVGLSIKWTRACVELSRD